MLLDINGILLYSAALLCVWYIISATRTWYRLRHVPTPSFLAGISYLWLARVTYGGKQYWTHRDLHRNLGGSPLVRIGPREVTTDDPAVLRAISSAHSTFRRSTWYLSGRFNPYHDTMFTLLEPAPHRRAKARSLPAYTGTPGLERCVDGQVATLVGVLRERYMPAATPALLDLGTFSCYFTMDVMTRLAFGAETGYMRDEKDHYDFLGMVRDLWPRMSTSADVPWIREFLFSAPFLRLFGPKPTDKKGFGVLMGVAERYVAGRFESDEKKEGDILAALIKRGFSRDECECEALLLLMAGTESTACALRSILVHAITIPTVYAKLKAEIHLACREGRVSSPITLEEAKKLPYLTAVVYEGIRIRPPLVALIPKEVPEPGVTFHGHFLPAGTNVCANLSSLLCSTALFGPDADVFRPERFTELDDAARSEMERGVELAFGYGQWMCVGKTIAFMEMYKFVFEILRVFDVQVAHPMEPSEVQSYGVFIENGLRLRISKDMSVDDL